MKVNKLLILALLFCLPSFCLADDAIPRISVVGKAKQKVKPDQMEWSINISSKDKSLKKLTSKHLELSKDVLSAIKKKGVSKQDLKTTRMNLREDWSYTGGSRYKNGYIANTSVSFKSKQLSDYVDLWRSLSKYDEVTINNVSFTYSKHEELKEEIKTKALLNAKSKAEKMAKTLGASIGQVLHIAEANSQEPIPRRRLGLEKASLSLGQEPYEVGTESIISEVLVDFRIVQ